MLWPRNIDLSSSKSPVKSKSHCDWQWVSQSWCRAPSGAHNQIFITVWQSRSCLCGAPSLTRGRVCLLSESLSAISNLSWCKRYLHLTCYHSLTHSWSWALLEMVPIVQLLNKFPAFYGTRRFITVFTRALHWSLSSARSSHPILSL
jgi:hypothetical protein